MNLKLKHKFFLIILCANLLLCLVIIGVNWRGFDKQFAQYRSKGDLSQTQLLEKIITKQYADTQTITIDARFWGQVDKRIRAIPASPVEHERLRNRLVIKVNDELFIFRYKFTTDKQAAKELAKVKNVRKDIKWHNVSYENKVIAQVGINNTAKLMAREDRQFIDDQKRNFIIEIIASIIISIFMGLVGARIFSRPIERLSNVTQTLAKGDYNIDPPSEGQDELAQLDRDLYVLSQTLSSNMSAKNQWIADISHELRTPVAVIKAQIEAMLDGIRKATDENLGILAKQIDDLSKLINDLHELSMSDLGALNYQFSQISLSTSLHTIVEERPQTNMTIEQDIEANLFIFADRIRIEQLFRNLMQNSIKYTDAPGNILVEAKQHNQKVIIHWQDSGPGASNEQLEQLFDRLYRIEDSRNKQTGGSGLGLSICKNIIEAHQGNIRATHSELGGINIIIELPLEKKNV